ncbi:uracil-DNA glycosylase [Chitinispirillales bacterium ANBcel5]|uniref:uracil-DNA glycosylase n=1 Tax=Cellulosispirillum alkaliphilum TaxID=3039283 RepID=UPI002A528DA2|nr:uracil-DNA glycosylase [Chitinispirillales bacterium ANBcel5]
MDRSSLIAKYIAQQLEFGVEELILSHDFEVKRLFNPQEPQVVQKNQKHQVSAEISKSPSNQVLPPSGTQQSAFSKLNKLKPLPQPAKAAEVPLPSKNKQSKREELKELYFKVLQCNSCPLCAGRNKVVFGAGNVEAPLMVVGEAPGGEEDRLGLPFVGAAGELLDKMLGAININRDKDTFITNVLKCRPPSNRSPETAELISCYSILEQQAKIIQPRVYLALGRIAAHTMLNRTEGIAVLRKELHQFMGAPLLVTYHPAALLRQPQYKRSAWEDLQKLQRLLKDDTINANKEQ